MEQSMMGLKALLKIKNIDGSYFLQGNDFYYNLWMEFPDFPYFFIKLQGYKNKEYIKVSLRRVSESVAPHDEQTMYSLYGKYYKFLRQDPWDIEVRYDDFIEAFDSLEFGFMLDNTILWLNRPIAFWHELIKKLKKGE